jgi:hypothetical protein
VKLANFRQSTAQGEPNQSRTSSMTATLQQLAQLHKHTMPARDTPHSAAVVELLVNVQYRSEIAADVPHPFVLIWYIDFLSPFSSKTA